MKYGVVPIGGSQEAIVAINAKSDADDFPDGLSVDPGVVRDNWPLADCTMVRELPIYNLASQSDDTGVVYSNAGVGFVPAFDRPRHSDTTLVVAATAALVGGALAALIWKRRR